VGPALDRMAQLLDEMPRMDILAEMRGSPRIALPAIGEATRRFPLIFRMIQQIDRVAIVIDENWVGVASRITAAFAEIRVHRAGQLS